MSPLLHCRMPDIDVHAAVPGSCCCAAAEQLLPAADRACADVAGQLPSGLTPLVNSNANVQNFAPTGAEGVPNAPLYIPYQGEHCAWRLAAWETCTCPAPRKLSCCLGTSQWKAECPHRWPKKQLVVRDADHLRLVHVPRAYASCGMLLLMKCCWGVAWRADMCSFLGAFSGLHFHRWQHAAWPASQRHRGDGARRQQQLSQRQCQCQCVLLGRRFRIGQCQCHCNQQQRLNLSPDGHKLCRVACAGLMSLLH